MLRNEEELTLVHIELISFDDKTTGDLVEKYKYTFMDKDDNIKIGYLDNEQWQDRVSDKATFSKEKAFNVPWVGKEFRGVITWKLAEN